MTSRIKIMRRGFIATALAIAFIPAWGHALVAGAQTLPITAVSFPHTVIPVSGGRIEFWARLTSDYAGPINVGGSDAHFFRITDGRSTYQLGFNANDGTGGGGLVGMGGDVFFAESGFFYGPWTFARIYGAGHVHEWHFYSFQWDEDVSLKSHRVHVYIDGVLNSRRFHVHGSHSFPPLSGGTFNLITNGGPALAEGGPIQMQDLKIYDREGNLLLSNTLASKFDVEHSAVGENGSFNGGGAAHFVVTDHGSGRALSARPVSGQTPP